MPSQSAIDLPFSLCPSAYLKFYFSKTLRESAIEPATDPYFSPCPSAYPPPPPQKTYNKCKIFYNSGYIEN